MFQPASLKGESPVPIDERIRKKYMFLYIIIIILSFIPCSIFEYTYFIFLFSEQSMWLFFLLLPFNIVILIYVLQFSAAIISALFLVVIKTIFNPKEGIFRRDPKDKDYFFWNLRNLVKKWPLHVMASNPFPWLKHRAILRFFGVKIGKKSICDNCWISSEFVSIGNNCIIGVSSVIISFGVEAETFLLKKIIIEDNVALGAKSVILPGTTIKRNVKLSAYSSTDYDDILEEGQIYNGSPASKIEEVKIP